MFSVTHAEESVVKSSMNHRIKHPIISKSLFKYCLKAVFNQDGEGPGELKTPATPIPGPLPLSAAMGRFPDRPLEGAMVTSRAGSQGTDRGRGPKAADVDAGVGAGAVHAGSCH